MTTVGHAARAAGLARKLAPHRAADLREGLPRRTRRLRIGMSSLVKLIY